MRKRITSVHPRPALEIRGLFRAVYQNDELQTTVAQATSMLALKMYTFKVQCYWFTNRGQYVWSYNERELDQCDFEVCLNTESYWFPTIILAQSFKKCHGGHINL